MIDGLKVTLTGDELLRRLDERITAHRASAEHWDREAARTADDQNPDVVLLPTHICENEAERHEWRAEVLEFVREHLDQSETYRLGEADLEFAELLPPEPEPAWFGDGDTHVTDAESAVDEAPITASAVE
jgi:hypothetical protein